ncbi:unnamed protein product [Adineta steineri]|uniref:Uncharacterized protein n=1 Tax=Adineta steineri TaxID=433720 RepID=A0A814GJI2_9BILA|nr:unnamed protein product [Adineta steineri]CAF1221837.1 unnamed protein product [Adineta steineri]
MLLLMMTIFASIATITAILIVCFTSPKSSNNCEMVFRQTITSSLVYDSLPRFGTAADLNNDNRMDIIVANSGANNIGIFISNLDGTYQDQQTYSTGDKSRPYSLATNYFNNDNYLDIVVANYDAHNIGIFFGYGNGTFKNQSIFSTGSAHPLFIAAADLNNDNQSDLVIIHYGTNSIGIYLGKGNGSFQDGIIYSTGYDSIPNSLAIADINKDNHLDIVVANFGTNNIGLFFAYGNGTFKNQIIYTTTRNSNPISIATGDVNNDNEIDIIVANSGLGNIGVFINYGNETFTEQTTYLIDSNAHLQFINVGFLNDDNYLDVIVANSKDDQIYVLPGSSNGSFTKLTTYDSITTNDIITNSTPFSIIVADFDGNNRADIAITDYGTNDILILNSYSDILAVRETLLIIGLNSLPTMPLVHDFNNDGILDIAVNNFNNNYILIFLGTGNANFIRGPTYGTGDKSTPQFFSIGDVNNDNQVDIVIANSGTNGIGVLLGQKDGSFSTAITYSTGINSAPLFSTLYDLNNDNQLDIVSANYGIGSIGVFLGSGNGIFANVTTYSTGTGSLPYTVAISDLNNDTYPDIVVSNSLPNRIGIFLAYGNGSFGKITTYATGAFNAICVTVVLVDLNKDTKLDIVATIPLGGIIVGLLGNGDGSFQSPITYSNQPATLPFCITLVDYNNDNYYDMLVANYGTNEILIFLGYGNGSLIYTRKYSTGSNTIPYGLTVADLNDDKHLEIIVALRGTGSVGILTEYYAAEFTNHTTHSTGTASHPKSIAVGDFNNDNKTDVVVANSATNSLGIFLGLNNGTFNEQIIYSLTNDSNPQYVITDDINKDGNLDIITVSSGSNTMSIIMGYGNGTFTDQIIYPTGTGSYPNAIVMSDLNNNNRRDFVVANRGSDSIGIFFGFEYVYFQDPQIYPILNAQNPYAIVVSNFNNDNYLDIAVASINSNNLAILLGQKNGTFTLIATYITGNKSNPTMLSVRDLNNDNQMDIIVANPGNDNIGVYYGYGNGSFANMIAYPTGINSNPRVMAFDDFNNDNLTDMVSVNAITNSIGILLRQNDGSFLLTNTFSTGVPSRPQGVTIDDFNNDGQLDIVVCNSQSSTIGIFLGYGNGSFQNQVTYSTGTQANPEWLASGDLNNDNRSDIAVANYIANTIGIFLGQGNGSFAIMIAYSSGDGSGPIYLTIIDINNDNVPDIVVANFVSNYIVVLYGLGDGTFLLGKPYSTGTLSSPQSLAIVDMNKDGQLDIISANVQSNTISILYAFGYENFGSPTKYLTGDGSQPNSVVVTDINNDGSLDILVANYGTDNIGIFLGYNNGKFNTMIIYSLEVGSKPFFINVGHFDNDNISDIVVSNSETDNIAILSHYNNGTFTSITTYSTGTRSQPYTIAIGDLNNDNQLDLAITNSGTSNILLLFGCGNGSFTNAISYPLGYNYLPYSLAITNLNQDKWMDIVIASYNADHIQTLVKMC